MAVFPPAIALNSANRIAIGSEIEHPISLASEYPEYDCHWYLLSHPSVPWSHRGIKLYFAWLCGSIKPGYIVPLVWITGAPIASSGGDSPLSQTAVISPSETRIFPCSSMESCDSIVTTLPCSTYDPE